VDGGPTRFLGGANVSTVQPNSEVSICPGKEWFGEQHWRVVQQLEIWAPRKEGQNTYKKHNLEGVPVYRGPPMASGQSSDVVQSVEVERVGLSLLRRLELAVDGLH
jgi:hypothetical protein